MNEQTTNWTKIRTLLSHEGEIANLELAYRFIDALQMGQIAAKDAIVWRQTQNKQLLPVILEAAPHLLNGQRKLDLSGIFRGGKPVPQGLAQIQGLKELDLSNNGLTELPPCVQQMSELRVLNLQRNALEHLPAFAHTMPKLRRLELGHNHLAALPRTIAKMPALRYLTLAHNYINRVSVKGIAALPQLQSLDLRANWLAGLPTALASKLPATLERLDLSANPLQTLPPVLQVLAIDRGMLVQTDTSLAKLCAPLPTITTTQQKQTAPRLPPRSSSSGQMLRGF